MGIGETHCGGVVQVRHPAGRWGAVPEAMLEDERLSLDTRGVAAWLATRPPSWQIKVAALRRRLGVGRERWFRIARELERSGYLRRDKYPGGPGGKWVWHIEFSPVSTVVGSADHGVGAVVGSADHGAAVDGGTANAGADPIDISDTGISTESSSSSVAQDAATSSMWPIAGRLAGRVERANDPDAYVAAALRAEGLRADQATITLVRELAAAQTPDAEKRTPDAAEKKRSDARSEAAQLRRLAEAGPPECKDQLLAQAARAEAVAEGHLNHTGRPSAGGSEGA